MADGFPLSPGDPYEAGHRLVSRYLVEALARPASSGRAKDFPTGQAILASDKPAQVEVVHALVDRFLWLLLNRNDHPVLSEGREVGSRGYYTQAQLVAEALRDLLEALTGRQLPYGEADVRHLVEAAAADLEAEGGQRIFMDPIPGLVSLAVKQAERLAESGELPPDIRAGLERVRARLESLIGWAGYAKTFQRVTELLGAAQPGIPDAGEAWADALRADLAEMPAKERAAWSALLAHAPVANQAKPSAKWIPQARKLLDAVGEEAFRGRLAEWLDRVGKTATERISDRSGDILKGLLWYCSLVSDSSISRTVADAAEACFRKLPNGGLRSSRAGRACLYTLGALPGMEPVAQLARLRLRVKGEWAQEEIEKAFAAAVQRAGLSPDEVEELTVPTYGLKGAGVLRSELGGFVSEIRIAGTRETEWSWTGPDGKPQAAVPAAVKREHAEELKALKRAESDVRKMLPAQRERLERLFLSGREWPLSLWRERYVDHPLLAQMCRRLIWSFGDGRSGIYRDGGFVDAEDRPLEGLGEETRVRLWHPLEAEAEAVRRWREWLQAHEVTQPFKQAYREIYVLTDAERETRTYSNRFAAHILKQHQLHALCGQRGWKYEYWGSWDGPSTNGAERALPRWSLQAEFWTEGAGDRFSEAGVCLYVSTDQVRFLRGGTPLPLEEVPPLVFSEVMRDVDLFVSVCSVAADPAWGQPRVEPGADTAEPEAPEQYRNYWESYSFGELNATAVTRREALERLLPRLKIRDRCRLDGRFLHVRGDLRSYKIHLGSGNILMEPNDQYLCIVPERRSAPGGFFLPFEGDDTLSVILSKAFLLAEDRRIEDPTIVDQIGG